MNVQTPMPATPDLATIKSRQQAAWGSGDYAIIGTTLQIVGETLCEAVDLRSNQRVLDVAAGNGNATLAAARRFAEVVSTDYVATLLERGRERAAADRLPVTFQEADAENLPFGDASFDVVLSTFGVMFTPNQQKAASELVRVCRPGGKIGLANWTPDSFVGQVFKAIGKYIPPAPGMKSPMLWGDRAHLDTLFGGAGTIAAEQREFVFRYRSPNHWVEVFKEYYGPMVKALAAVDADARKSLLADLHDDRGQVQRCRGRHRRHARRLSRSGRHQEALTRKALTPTQAAPRVGIGSALQFDLRGTSLGGGSFRSSIACFRHQSAILRCSLITSGWSASLARCTNFFASMT